jgi:hypothetical protein
MVEFVHVGGISFDRNAKIYAQNNTIIYRFAFVLQISQSTIRLAAKRVRSNYIFSNSGFVLGSLFYSVVWPTTLVPGYLPSCENMQMKLLLINCSFMCL